MKKIVFTEKFCQPELLFPFSLTKRLHEIRLGVLTIREKWERMLDMDSFPEFENNYKDNDNSYHLQKSPSKDLIYLIHGNILPSAELIKAVKKLKSGEFLSVNGKEGIAYCISGHEIKDPNRIQIRKAIELTEDIREIKFPWDLINVNDWAIRQDVMLFKKSEKFQRIPASNKLIRGSDVYMEKGAVAEHCIFNAEAGPIYICRNAKVMEGTMIKGPVSIGQGAVIKMGARIYGATTIGPGCIAGGEIKNSILTAWSNKAHDGYLGDSVIGDWCNLGAGTSNSNIKNNVSDVMVWTKEGLVNAGKKCGMFMGDYSRTAINTSINTGTVIGICCNIFGQGLTPKYIPSFSWGNEGIARYNLEKSILDIQNWKTLKHQDITPYEKAVLKHIFDYY